MTKDQALATVQRGIGKSIYRVGSQWMVSSESRKETQARYRNNISEWIDVPEQVLTSVPHNEITPGLWYVKTGYAPYYEVVSILEMQLGPEKGQLGVWSIDQEGNNWLADYSEDQFICRVPPPGIEEQDRLRDFIRGLVGSTSREGGWKSLVEPLVARFDVAANFGGDAVHNPEGSRALAELLRAMAEKLDRAIEGANQVLGDAR